MDILNQEFVRLLNISGWNQSEAARQLELSPAVITRYCANDTRPSLTVLKLFKMLIGDTKSLPGEYAPGKPANQYDRPLDQLERDLLADLRQLDNESRRKMTTGFRTILTIAERVIAQNGDGEAEPAILQRGGTAVSSTVASAVRAGARAGVEKALGSSPKSSPSPATGGPSGRKGSTKPGTGGR